MLRKQQLRPNQRSTNLQFIHNGRVRRQQNDVRNQIQLPPRMLGHKQVRTSQTAQLDLARHFGRQTHLRHARRVCLMLGQRRLRPTHLTGRHGTGRMECEGRLGLQLRHGPLLTAVVLGVQLPRAN